MNFKVLILALLPILVGCQSQDCSLCHGASTGQCKYVHGGVVCECETGASLQHQNYSDCITHCGECPRNDDAYVGSCHDSYPACRCSPGYTLSPEYFCVRTCEQCSGIANGDGTCASGADGACGCKSGYKINAANDTCVDACEAACPASNGVYTGTCITNGGEAYCGCQADHKHPDGQPLICESGDPCVDGACPTEDGRTGTCTTESGLINCECQDLYTHKGDLAKCVLDCSSCRTDQHGILGPCTLSEGSVVCDCIDGYANPVGQPLQCLKEGNCDGVVCPSATVGYTGECAVAGRTGRCVCDTNYKNSPSDAFECIPDCSPCEMKDGHTGDCIPVGLGITCSCADGYLPTGDAPLHCEDACAAFTCDDSQVGVTGKCTTVGGAGACACEPGYKADPSDRSNCIEVNACEGITCSSEPGYAGTACHTEAPGDLLPVCDCIPEYKRDPSDRTVCTPDCSGCGGQAYSGTCRPTEEGASVPVTCDCADGYIGTGDALQACVDACDAAGVTCNKSQLGQNGVCTTTVGGIAITAGCECLAGFQTDLLEPTKCQPDCDMNCMGATTYQCANIDNAVSCECLPGASPHNQLPALCVTDCGECPKGTEAYLGSCDSITGHCACNPGYMRDSNTGLCERDCSHCDGIANGDGTCATTGRACGCKSGYKINAANDTCVDACEAACPASNAMYTGTCITNGGEAYCGCQAGHKHPDGQPLICESGDPCVDGACPTEDGRTGTCAEESGLPKCGCAAGYTNDAADLTKCVPNCTSCDKTTNGILGSCEVSGGLVKCDCASGYVNVFGDALKCAELVDCDDSNSCPGAVDGYEGGCTPGGGSVICICSSGYVNDPSDPSKCILFCGEACMGQDSLSGTCTPTDAGNICDCADNYVRNKEGVCVDVCYGFTCRTTAGYSGNCVPSNGVVTCQCDQYYVNNSDDPTRCIPDCSPCENKTGYSGVCSPMPGGVACGCESPYVAAEDGSCIDQCTAAGYDCDGSQPAHTGNCNIIEGKPACECIDGASPDQALGSRCRPNCNDRCKGETNGTCEFSSPDGREIRCECLPGASFDMDDFQRCVTECGECPTDDAAYVGSCDRDTGRCTCSIFHTYNPTTHECERDCDQCIRTANGDGTCASEADGGACGCASGYVATDDGTACVDACDGSCPASNAMYTGTCITNGGEAYCGCQAGHKHPDGQPLICESGDPCVDGACPVEDGRTGTCTEDSGLPNCECQDLYTHTGDLAKCVLDCSSCRRSKQGILESCTVSEGAVVCDCEDDYSNPPDDTTQCLRMTVCNSTTCPRGDAYTGECVAGLGAVVCRCSDGYTNDSLDKTICVPGCSGFECDSEQPEYTGACTTAAGGTGRCACRNGYKSDPNDVSKCIAGDPCDGVTCDTGPAYSGGCVDYNGLPRCMCSLNYVNNVADLTECKPDCSSCVKKTGHTGRCNLESGIAICECSNNYTGQADGSCGLDCSKCDNKDGHTGGCSLDTRIICTCSDNYLSNEDGSCTLDCEPCFGKEGHSGTCAPLGDGITCDCAPGYSGTHDALLTCVPDCTSCTGDHTTGNCDVVLGQVVCACSDGFKPGEESNTCVNACTELNCDGEQEGSTGACTTGSGGAATCACSPGYKTDPENASKCISGDPCEGITCSNGVGYTGACAELNGLPSCTCDSPYENNPTDTTKCVLDCSSCKNIPNGSFGRCTASSGKVMCICLEGYSDDLKTTPKCTVCADGYNKSGDGTCADACDATMSCGTLLGQTGGCTTADGTARCACEPGFSYDNQLESFFNICRRGHPCSDYNCSKGEGYLGTCEELNGFPKCLCADDYINAANASLCVPIEAMSSSSSSTSSSSTTASVTTGAAPGVALSWSLFVIVVSTVCVAIYAR